MKQLQIEIYGDQKFIATADLKIPAYYAKAEIEGYGNDLLKQSISAMREKSQERMILKRKQNDFFRFKKKQKDTIMHMTSFA